MRKKYTLIIILALLILFPGCTKPPESEWGVQSFLDLENNPALTDTDLELPTPELVDRIFSRENARIFERISAYYISLSDIEMASDDYGRMFRICEVEIYDYCRKFNGLAELETRSDAAACLLKKYVAIDKDDIPSDAMGRDSSYHYFLMQCLEIVLSEDIFFSQLSDSECETLYKTLEDFYGEDRSNALCDGRDHSFRFYPYYPA